ncbi:hypothetical protein ABZW18_17530 [Streptomyces sp. NPDC004647]|uniref:hypothetical protein n=1 Tax=Streptomyces sp. NPDC004647 TaxID=3154671 RepID=UPI0033BEE519
MRSQHRLLAGGLLSAALGVGVAGAAHASGTDPVVVQPEPVGAGGRMAVFDGGNCRESSSGVATFSSDRTGSRIPALKLHRLENRIGAWGTVPLDTKAGSYKVSVVCHDDKGRVDGPFTGTLQVVSESTGQVGGRPDRAQEADRTGHASEAGGPDHPGGAGAPNHHSDAGRPERPKDGGRPDHHGDARRQNHPRGATYAGAGGSAGVDTREAALGAALMATAVSGAILLRRRARGGQD